MNSEKTGFSVLHVKGHVPHASQIPYFSKNLALLIIQHPLPNDWKHVSNYRQRSSRIINYSTDNMQLNPRSRITRAGGASACEMLACTHERKYMYECPQVLTRARARAIARNYVIAYRMGVVQAHTTTRAEAEVRRRQSQS